MSFSIIGLLLIVNTGLFPPLDMIRMFPVYLFSVILLLDISPFDIKACAQAE